MNETRVKTNEIRNKMNETKPKRTAFTIAPVEVKLVLDLDMAIALGDFILEARPSNPAIVALGHQLQNIMPPDLSDSNNNNPRF